MAAKILKILKLFLVYLVLDCYICYSYFLHKIEGECYREHTLHNFISMINLKWNNLLTYSSYDQWHKSIYYFIILSFEK